ncbi:MAG: thiol-disulfide oxidoreductase DCC family protein [Candidatus Pelagibacterales bacterium]|jgi:predicted DCC family thiol-disulfide oxidoreductase YuxK|tara:strand:- start:163 stop:543 length:381 start_codon:yes stop_codon:yes gene_type:complete
MNKQHSEKTPKVYFNNSCSVCRMEINHYKKFNEKLGWIDVTNNKEAQKETAKSSAELIRRLHVEQDGKIYQGIDAFLIVWSRLPKYRWLYKLVKTPGIYHASYIAYECLAYILFIKNKGQLANEKS